MKQSEKEFIIEAHKHACSEWKNKISDEFPELFKLKPLEVGGWYKYPDFENWKLRITDIDGANVKGYGFNMSSSFIESWVSKSPSELDGVIPCTEKEVETALIQEAKKRGVKKGVKIKCLSDSKTCTVIEMNFSSNLNNLWVKQYENGVWCKLFDNGKWATIIETITKEQAEKELGKTILN